MTHLVANLPGRLMLALVAGAVALAACATESSRQNDAFGTEIEACHECQAILVECSSTSLDEEQFVLCRDQWQSCQQGHGLGADDCHNPSDAEACTMCRGRLQECQARGENLDACDSQFSVCKAFLITRADVAQGCTEQVNTPEQVGCDICRRDLTLCLSDGSGASDLPMCSSKFETCLQASGVDQAVCAMPSGDDGCQLCLAQHAECDAAAGTDCDEGLKSCAAAIAAEVSCEAGGGAGGSGGGGAGGSGAGGSGAGGGGGSSCAHDACLSGDALDAGCSTCATLVCDQDPYCCDTAWDAVCTDAAAGVPACGCP